MCIPVWPSLCLLVTHFLVSLLGWNVYMHQYISLSTWFPVSAQPLLHSCMEMCILVCCHVNVPVTLIWSHTLVRMCTCIRICMHIHWTMSLPPLCIVAHKHLCHCGPMCVSQSPLIWSLVRMCTYISTCMHVHLTSHMCPPLHSCVQTCVPLWYLVCVPVTPLLVPHLG